MSLAQRGLANVSLGSTKAIGVKLVQEGKFENLSEACRAGLRRLEEDDRVINQLIALGEAGIASGVDEDFNIDSFIDDIKTV